MEQCRTQLRGDVMLVGPAFIALVSATSHSERCMPINIGVLRSKVEDVLSTQVTTETSRKLGELAAYWRSQCVRSKWFASPKVVFIVERLLRDPVARLTASSMLMDIGENLHYSEQSLRGALVDEERSDREAEHKNPLVAPTSGRSRSLSLQCLIWRIRYKTHNAELCRYLDRL